MALTQQILLKIVSPALHVDVGPRLDVVSGGCHLTGQHPRLVLLHDHPVLAHLLLDEDHLLRAPDHKVAARVVRALVEACQLGLRFAREDAVRGAEHYWHPANGQTIPDDPLLSPSVFNVHGNGSGVGDVSQPGTRSYNI